MGYWRQLVGSWNDWSRLMSVEPLQAWRFPSLPDRSRLPERMKQDGLQTHRSKDKSGHCCFTVESCVSRFEAVPCSHPRSNMRLASDDSNRWRYGYKWSRTRRLCRAASDWLARAKSLKDTFAGNIVNLQFYQNQCLTYNQWFATMPASQCFAGAIVLLISGLRLSI